MDRIIDNQTETPGLADTLFDQEQQPVLGLRTTGPLVDPRYRPTQNSQIPKILIVDDDPGVRRFLSTLLSDLGECETASDGSEAIERLQTTGYHVILCDIMMPRVTGFAVLDHVRRTAPSTAIIMATALNATSQAVDAIRKGAFDYLVKPFNLDEVEASVKRALKYREAVEENRFYQQRLEDLVVERTAHLQSENERLQGLFLEQTLSNRAILRVLTAAVEARGLESPNHTELVAAYALRLGQAMGLSEPELEALEMGSLLHDIGTIMIPDSILRKTGTLTPEERAVMQAHTEYGVRLLNEIGMTANALPLVEQHHERWDGAGYPHQLQGAEIDLLARIFAVADCIEAITNDRPYRRAKGFDEAAQEIARCSGKQFDPAVVEAFFSVSFDEWERIAAKAPRRALPVTGPLVLPAGISLS